MKSKYLKGNKKRSELVHCILRRFSQNIIITINYTLFFLINNSFSIKSINLTVLKVRK